MTIVHIGPPHLPILYSRGGATERRMRELSIRQSQSGARVIIYSADEANKTEEHRGVEIRSVPCRYRGIVRAAEFLFHSLRDARSVKPDVIHFHSLAEGAAFANFLAPELHAKTVLSFDFFEFRRGKRNPCFPWYRRALERFSSLLPVSMYCHRQSAAYWSIPESRMRVLYNGVSLQQFRPDRDSAALRRAELKLNDSFVVLYVGRVCHQKGTDLLLDACARLRSQGRNVRVVVAGPIGQFGESSDNGFRRLLDEHGAVYLGAVEEATLPSIYNLADVFVMPTRAHEMFGMAAIEAQACGKPVICSNHGGLPEVIRPSSGMLFRLSDVEDLTEKLRTLIDDTEMRRRFSDGAVENARRFAWENITDELFQVYQQA